MRIFCEIDVLYFKSKLALPTGLLRDTQFFPVPKGMQAKNCGVRSACRNGEGQSPINLKTLILLLF